MPQLFQKDIFYLKSSVEELENFLLSDDTIRILPDLTLSVGGILLANYKLNAAGLSSSVSSDWATLMEIRENWKTTWKGKCSAEYKMRLRQWGDFILGMASDKNEPSTAFKHQVRNRVILHFLLLELPDQSAELIESLSRKDKILEKYSVDNEFVWENVLESGFPRDEFWYLYRTMKYEKGIK
jgi:hypothetical protein